MNKINNAKDLTVNTKIICNNNPEWGSWRIVENNKEWLTVEGRSGQKILGFNEAETFYSLTN